MSEVAVIGPSAQIAGFALAGARIYPACGPEQARAAWSQLPPSVGVVLLCGPAADAIGAAAAERGAPLTVRLPA